MLDAGALIAFEQGNRAVRALVQRARARDAALLVPAGVLAQVWRSGSRQARLAGLLGARDTRVEDLTAALARSAGELCGRRGTSDVIDASLAVGARRVHAIVVTSDPDDIRHLDASLTIVPI
jgi:hypothetical protein